MKPVTTFVLLLVASVLVTACNKVSHKKTPGGMPYKVYPGKGSTLVKPGHVIKLNFTQQIKDSVYFTTRGKMPMYWPVSEQTTPYDISELFSKLRKGDSVIATQMMDTFIKRNPQLAAQYKNGDRIISTIKILDVFTSDSLARIDEQKENEAWLKGEIDFLQKYVDDKKINVQKTPSGAFVEIINPGQGNTIDSGKYISVKYTGTSFSGKIFDSNIDSTISGRTEPMSFEVGTTPMIKGFDEAVRMLRMGSEARFYIPSMLAYGPRPQSPDIKPFEHITFYIKVVDVKDAAPAPKIPAAQKVDAPQPK